ncbi:MAG: GH116 family glycosyl hydrolase [Elusimicrobiota bacterium]
MLLVLIAPAFAQSSSVSAEALDMLPGGELKVEKVAVSSIENNKPELRGEFAVDGNMFTRWSSEKSDPQSLTLDLGSAKKFNLVTINWEAAYAKKYEIQTSKDGNAFSAVHAENNGKGGKEIIVLKPQTSRFVRLYCLERATEYGDSVFEIKVAYKMMDDGKVPAAPAGFSAVGGDDVIFLQWNRSAEPDILGYNVYRSKNPGADFEKLTKIPVKTLKYNDKAGSAETLHYYVTALDFTGNESPASAKVSVSFSKQKERSFFPIPSCAWKHNLGDIPDGCVSSSPNRGVAIGGFGAGSFMYTICGSFGPFQRFDDTLYRELWLPQAAFHIYEKVGRQDAVVKCLSTDEQLKKGWNKLRTGDGIYYALQPKGWVTYGCFNTDISQKFFTPIIPKNYKETSYPAGVWQFRIYNSAKEDAQVGVMLTFPGVYVGDIIKAGNFVNSEVSENGVTGVVMKSRNGAGQWCIASKKLPNTAVSYTTSWNGDGDGLDIATQFKERGALNNRNLDNSNRAAAIAVTTTLKPGEEITIPIVITWDFPVTKFGSGTEWWKKYTEYFGRSGENAFKIAAEALENYSAWEAKIDEWMNPVIKNDKYPDWLKCAAFNELYYDQFGGVFYESGLKSGRAQEYKGLHVDDHKHFVLESPVYTSANTLDVRHYASLDFALFWPDIERDTLKCFADGTMHYQFVKPVPKGLAPHDVGDPRKCDPYFEYDVYRHDIPDLVYWKDLSPKFVQQCWRYYYLYKDKKFLDYVWPSMKAVFDFMKSTDKNGDYLPDNSGSDNTYDAWGLYGTSLLCGGLWVGALECLEQMAIAENDNAMLQQIRGWLKKAKVNLDSQLWSPGQGYYKMDTQGKHPGAIMSDGLNGQLFCHKYGLEDILPKERMSMHLKMIFDKCVKPMKDYTGDGIGDIGAINAVNMDGSYLGTVQSDEIWTGSSYFLAALMYNAGMKEEALKTAYGIYFNTYINPETAFWFNTPESWRVNTMRARPNNPEQYQRPRAVWELLLEIDNPYAR